MVVGRCYIAVMLDRTVLILALFSEALFISSSRVLCEFCPQMPTEQSVNPYFPELRFLGLRFIPSSRVFNIFFFDVFLLLLRDVDETADCCRCGFNILKFNPTVSLAFSTVLESCQVNVCDSTASFKVLFDDLLCGVET